MAPGQGAVVRPGHAPQRDPLPGKLLLSVRWPTQLAQRAHEVELAGRTSPGSIVRAGDAEVIADSRGLFSLRVPLRSGDNRPLLESSDLAGRRTMARAPRSILVDSRLPEIQHEGVRYGR